jgi:hypothetical protein
MKTKFEENVAAEIPKTRPEGEPGLPWKVTEEELKLVEGVDAEYKEVVSGSPPLHARAIFVILLVVSIFVVVMNTVINIAIDNSEMQLAALQKGQQVSTLKGQLQQSASEKAALNDSASRLEKKVSDLNADVLEGYLSSALCHMGNISYRLGQTASRADITERIGRNQDLAEAFERVQDHLLLNGVDVKLTPRVLGPWLTMDPQAERFAGEFADEANKLVRGTYREPFVVPEQV